MRAFNSRPAALFVSSTILLLTLVLPSPTTGQLGCATTCMGPTGGGVTCNVTVTSAYSPTCGAPPAVLEAIVGTPMNAACNLGAVDGMASVLRTSMQPTSASCSVVFVAFLAIPVGCTRPFTTNVTCLVSAADGLPVELMEFEIEEDSDSLAPDSDRGTVPD